MGDQHEDRLKKLLERTNEPLPAYQADGLNRVVRLSFESSSSECREPATYEALSDKKTKRIADIEASTKKAEKQQKKDEATH